MQARILIVDGHSIIFGWPNLRALHTKRNALAREALVKLLNDYRDFTGTHVVAVFDGNGAQVSEVTEPAGIQVFYSGEAQTADDVIERLVAKYAADHDITVATSDLLEQQTASAFGASCISADGLKTLLDEASVDLQKALRRQNRR